MLFYAQIYIFMHMYTHTHAHGNTRSFVSHVYVRVGVCVYLSISVHVSYSLVAPVCELLTCYLFLVLICINRDHLFGTLSLFETDDGQVIDTWDLEKTQSSCFGMREGSDEYQRCFHMPLVW